MIQYNSLNEINRALQALTEEVKQEEIQGNQIKDIEDSLVLLKIKLNDLKEQLRQEEKEVERLQSISLANFFRSFSNNKPDRISQTEQKVREVNTQIKNVQYEIDEKANQIICLQVKVKDIADCESKYTDLMRQKKNWIQKEMPEKLYEIENKSNQIKGIKLRQEDLKETLIIGVEILSRVSLIENSLTSARDWSINRRANRDMLAAVIKADQVNDIGNKINELQKKVDSFINHLKDSSEYLSVDLGIRDSVSFLYEFFNEFFIDFALLAQIENGLKRVRELNNHVGIIIKALHIELKSIEEKEFNLQKESNEIIKDA